MTEHLRERLHEEMSGFPPPPADNLVALAVADGLRTRRVRRTASGLGTVAVVGLTVLALTVGSQLGAGRSASLSGQAGSGAVAQPLAKPETKPVVKAAATVAAVPTTAAAVTDKLALATTWHTLQGAASSANPPQWTPAATGVPATPQAELQLFADLAAPYGLAGSFAVSQDADKTHVRATLTDAAGRTGGLQFSLEHDTLGRAADCLAGSPDLVRCDDTPDGGYVIVADDHAGCVNTADLSVVHPDGTVVHVFLASCVTDLANTLTPGTQTLSTAQAEQIFSNPGFDFAMHSDVVASGAQLGNLATFW